VQSITVAGQSRAVSITRLDDPAEAWPWREIRGDLDTVRRDPGRAVSDAKDHADAEKKQRERDSSHTG